LARAGDIFELVFRSHNTTPDENKKAQLTPWLARDSAATWRIILNSATAAGIEALTCAAT